MSSASHLPTANERRFPTLWVVGTLRLLAVTALGFACFLAWSAYQAGDIAGCSGGGIWDCSHVLHSKWAKWMSIPVSIPAAALYTSMLFSLLFVGDGVPSNVRLMAWRIVTILAFAAALAALWFIYLQFFVLEHLCKYCLVVHTCGLLIAMIALFQRPFPSSSTFRMAGLSAMAAAALILGQVFGKAPQTYEVEVHEPATHASADDFSAPSDELASEFGSPDEFAAPDVFAAPDEAVFENPLDSEQTRTISTTISEADELGPPDPSLTRVPPLQLNSPLQLGPATGNPPQAAPARRFPDTAQPSKEYTIRQIAHEVLLAQAEGAPERGKTVAASAEAPPKKRLIRYPGADVNLNVANWPMLGSETAPHVVVELFDYTCPYCRTMHKHISEAQTRFGGQIAFIVMPVPLGAQCNPTVQNTAAEHVDACEIASLALAVWRCDESKFETFHHWLMAGDRARTAAEARQQAETLVDATELRKVLAKPIVSQFIERHVALYKRAGEGTLPKLLTERVTVRGKMDSAEDFCRTLQNNLQLQP